MSELKPCLKCNSKNVAVKQNFQLGGMTFFICNNCGLVASFRGAEQFKPAKKAWNTRAQPKQPSDEEILDLAGCPWQVNDNEDFIAVVRAVLDKWGR